METEASWEEPRHKLGTKKSDKLKEGYAEMLPVRDNDGQWKRVQKKKKTEAPPPAEDDGQDEAAAAAAAAAAELESAALKRSKIAKTSASILEAPHKHVGLLNDLQHYASHDRSPAIQRLALLSTVAVLRDLIPAYRIRPPTDKEMKMQVTKEVEALREFERKLLLAYEACIATLQKWLKASLEAHRSAAVRGICALLDKGFDFNMRDELIAALVPVANSSDAAERTDACAALVTLFEHDTHGEATLAAVRATSNLLKHSSFNVQPEVTTAATAYFRRTLPPTITPSARVTIPRPHASHGAHLFACPRLSLRFHALARCLPRG